jgi:aspartate racemase
MKTIGLIGGTGWVSTVEYYRIINREFNKRLGGYNFPKCILYSINHGDVIEYNKKGDMEGLYTMLLNAANKLIEAGADFVLMCANTTHMFADMLVKEISVPFIHIGTATAEEIKRRGLYRVGLLGTKATMEQDFLKSKLIDENIEVIIPNPDYRDFINKSILEELIKDIFAEETRNEFKSIIKSLQAKGAEGVILGCTEIPLLIKQENVEIPVFDTTLIHSLAAVDFALENI